MTADLVDPSVWSLDDENGGELGGTVALKIFCKPNASPDLLCCGDVLRIHRARVQQVMTSPMTPLITSSPQGAKCCCIVFSPP